MSSLFSLAFASIHSRGSLYDSASSFLAATAFFAPFTGAFAGVGFLAKKASVDAAKSATNKNARTKERIGQVLVLKIGSAFEPEGSVKMMTEKEKPRREVK